ncbi:hypothetical protein, partial [Pseudomonas gessardii]
LLPPYDIKQRNEINLARRGNGGHTEATTHNKNLPSKRNCGLVMQTILWFFYIYKGRPKRPASLPGSGHTK